MNKQDLLRALPKVDDAIEIFKKHYSVDAADAVIKKGIQEAIEKHRRLILQDVVTEKRDQKEWLAVYLDSITAKLSPNLKRMINGTGVVIHTNLGRSLLSKKTADALMQAASFYSNLEFNLETGKRGSRYSLVEDVICELTGAEAALVVNNNAAAVFLALDTLSRNSEVIVSRGQLVEIGGSFRIPDVMARSGATLVEVGATNRTHLYDYEHAITDETSMLMRVHTSNFRLIGFTSTVEAYEMVQLAKEHNLLTMEDLGSGSLIDLSSYGFPKEPTVQELVKAGVDVVTFSGDKLLGGPQAGIIVGSKEVIERIKKNPMNRALRIDKFTLASLEIILRYYYDIPQALKEVPTLRMLTTPPDVLKKRAQSINRRLRRNIKDICPTKVIETVSRVGGGACPEFDIASYAVEFSPQTKKMSEIENSFRGFTTPIIGRVENEKYLIDVRTIQDEEIPLLTSLICDYFTKEMQLR